MIESDGKLRAIAFFTKRSRAAINIYASHSRHAKDDTSVANTSRRWVSSGAVSCRNVHRTPYGHTPCILKLRHRTVRSPRGLFSARSSLSPWANWHLRPYGHRPSALYTRHICVLYLSPVAGHGMVGDACRPVQQWRRVSDAILARSYSASFVIS